MVRAALVVVGVLTLITVMLCAVIEWSLSGGIPHTPHDLTVNAARSKGSGLVTDTVEWAETRLAPILGGPLSEASEDMCVDKEWASNDIWCSITGYLLYPLPSELSNAQPETLVATLRDQTTTDVANCTATYSDGSSRSCLDRHGTVTVAVYRAGTSTTAKITPPNRSEVSVILLTSVGTGDFNAAAQGRPCVVVSYSHRYFRG